MFKLCKFNNAAILILRNAVFNEYLEFSSWSAAKICQEVYFRKIHLTLQKSVPESRVSVFFFLLCEICVGLAHYKSFSKAAAILPYLFESQLAQNEKPVVWLM